MRVDIKKKKENGNCFFVYIYTVRNINDDLLIAADARAQFAVLAEVVVESRARQILLADVESVSARRQGVDRVQVPLCIYVCVCVKSVSNQMKKEIIIYAQKLNFLSYIESPRLLLEIFLRVLSSSSSYLIVSSTCVRIE